MSQRLFLGLGFATTPYCGKLVWTAEAYRPLDGGGDSAGKQAVWTVRNIQTLRLPNERIFEWNLNLESIELPSSFALDLILIVATPHFDSVAPESTTF
ncbi:uncharacterized protein BP5553_10435 [Venustampulla echinocandica]|uniref:Uncharacterized protein n=1 Tax=Venustampulla echinocandica TaxID=2656787 RepID=A0A370T9A5_9HELO|nr:uncharacterized protein BP5553_10435 [Venustampulla echinocandica]RDL30157.1 hypothetical protein BP5553_10435 [Venustampulla echinocandica]